MAGGDGWWAGPLPPSSPTRNLLARTLGGGAFAVNGGGEAGLFSAFALSSASARGFNPGPAGVTAVKTEMRSNAIAGVVGGGGSVTSDSEVGFGGGGCSAGDWMMMPPPQQQQSPTRNPMSIAERRAARCGFSAPRINTARFRCSSGSPICSPAAVRSPCLTIPPGLSPTALLDSPVMLMDAQIQPSPTTGTFPLSPRNHAMLAAITLRNHVEDGNSENLYSSFVFKLPQDPVSMPCIQSAENKVQIQIEYESHAGPLGEILPKSCASDSQTDMEASDETVAKAKKTAISLHDPSIINDETQLEDPQSRNNVSQHVQDGVQAGVFPPSSMGRQSEDGFNWRKYGQKQVKGSEFPRSYYKCTHPDCQVKKKVERSYDGQITEIVYKGKHNHPKPQPARRSIIGSSLPVNELLQTRDNPGSPMKTESKYVWSTHHDSEEDRNVDCQMDGLERMSSTSAVTDLSDPLSTAIEKHLSELESTSNVVVELSSTIACLSDDDEHVTQESMPLEGVDEDDKSDSKRRKNENYMVEGNSASRAVREPRVVVQTESEVDILDDGYRWRKYGQKVVKGNPNPRSYYKCTNPGCSVRKHVERAAHDLKSVITTYEGKHNHEVPVSRNSSSTGGSFPPASNAPAAMTFPGSVINPEHTAIVKDLAPHFKRKLDLSNEYANPTFPNSLYGNTKFGTSSCYEMKLLQQLAFQMSGPSSDYTRLLPTSSITGLSSEFPISFPKTITRASDVALAGLNVKDGMAAGSAVQPLLGRHPNESSGQFLKAPKQELVDDAFSSLLPMDNFANAPPMDCGQIMDGYPLQ